LPTEGELARVHLEIGSSDFDTGGKGIKG
jgi:hypothetical protein